MTTDRRGSGRRTRRGVVFTRPQPETVVCARDGGRERGVRSTSATRTLHSATGFTRVPPPTRRASSRSRFRAAARDHPAGGARAVSPIRRVALSQRLRCFTGVPALRQEPQKHAKPEHQWKPNRRVHDDPQHRPVTVTAFTVNRYEDDKNDRGQRGEKGRRELSMGRTSPMSLSRDRNFQHRLDLIRLGGRIARVAWSIMPARTLGCFLPLRSVHFPSSTPPAGGRPCP